MESEISQALLGGASILITGLIFIWGLDKLFKTISKINKKGRHKHP
jgi:hypothetical protein